MNAILTCVNYAPELAITLPYNRHHFDRVLVVTAPQDDATCFTAIANDAEVHVTDAFYVNDDPFNKWRALEQGMDKLGRQGWLAVMDADVLWPKEIHMWPVDPLCRFTTGVDPTNCWLRGHLYSPRRRMCPHLILPSEGLWGNFPLQPLENEWSGYSQVFHADDVPGPLPWYDFNKWNTCQGADTDFHRRWPADRKVRPPWECLHLGFRKVAWRGRGKDLGG
jgi:hypothetical protein